MIQNRLDELVFTQGNCFAVIDDLFATIHSGFIVHFQRAFAGHLNPVPLSLPSMLASSSTFVGFSTFLTFSIRHSRFCHLDVIRSASFMPLRALRSGDFLTLAPTMAFLLKLKSPSVVTERKRVAIALPGTLLRTFLHVKISVMIHIVAFVK